MTFKPECVETFLGVFTSYKSQIRNAEGCTHLELWQDHSDKNVFFTYSHWLAEGFLENYRHSELFKEVWPQTKLLFLEKAEAWTVTRLVGPVD
jgi:(4S)-4-hydroxy-5-phosphonooxypentane-2,3-dione isomerase